MIARARLNAPIKTVYQALTDPTILQTWFAEHADVELPHRYAFWGRFTPEGDAPHQKLLHVDDRTLRFNWLLDGEDTTVELSLQPETDATTILTVSQTGWDFQYELTLSSIRGVLETFWALAFANLADYLEGRPLIGRCDFTSSELKMEMLIGASREAIFDSLVDSKKASAWFGYPIEIEAREGGRFAMGGFESGYTVPIVAFEPQRKVSIDWGQAGIMTWELEDSGGKTRLTFVQSGFTTHRPPYGAFMGTISGFAELRRYHEVPNWQSIWLAPEAAQQEERVG
jgi:uncharacterized protein YndB with AHSA1/START domain